MLGISLVLVCLVILLTYKYRKSRSECSDLSVKIVNLNSQIEDATLEMRSLEKYRGIQNVEVEIQKIQSDKILLLETIKQIEIESKAECDRIISEANKNATDIKRNADLEYSKRISLAEEKAKEIAGEAYETAKNVDRLEKTARALKNIIEGYGDQYLFPSTSLLDNLAETYSHTQAGEELKQVRDRIRAMIKNKSAADCDYVEQSRKSIAIDFVLDTFNGKVDTILSSVKQDNFGTLKQKIIDSYETVNANGHAFRNARINQTYLDVRLEELKLACTVHALREKDREEQRRIKEQLRDEEKAAREYEKALREAVKEQDSVNKAIDKIRKDMEAANDAKRALYEEKLKDLEVRLKEAEDKNKRAQSMAELTKSGHVYIISNVGSFGEDILKIGMTRRLDPMDRVWELGDASVPFEFDVHAMIYSEDAPALEKELHRLFSEQQVNKINPRKEFFNVGIFEIKQAVENKGLNVKWTMVAEAREFRESQALSKKKIA